MLLNNNESITRENGNDCAHRPGVTISTFFGWINVNSVRNLTKRAHIPDEARKPTVMNTKRTGVTANQTGDALLVELIKAL
jgi:hypothetical protein